MRIYFFTKYFFFTIPRTLEIHCLIINSWTFPQNRSDFQFMV